MLLDLEWWIGELFSEASQAMTQYRKGHFARTFNQCTAPSQGSVLQKRRFHHALVSDGRRSAKRRDITEELRTKCNEVLLINQDGPDVNQENGNTNELMHCPDTESLIKCTRKHRMRDQNGEVAPKKRKARALTSVMRSPSITWRGMGGCSSVTLNVRSLQFGTLTSIFRGPLTFSVDYLEIPGEVRIDASELSSCEWCRARRLPALFLQMTPAACCCRRDWLGMSAGTGDSYNCHSKNQEEKYLVIIFESDPTMLEKAALEEILAEIGRQRNVSNFPANLTFEEANNRLMARKHSHIKTMIPAPFTPTTAQMATISVSDTEDRDDHDNDLMECSPSQTQPVRKLLVYPPPPAKGGFTITEEDLQCLNEGELLNDVIVDFYLKYLVCEKLKEDGNRCHVFSSFFYRSLTHEDPRKNPDTTGLSVQEKRHNRVKTWTRHLDLFEKDFIFVPINELAHWFLVVICFPGQVSHCSALDSSGSRTESSAEYAPSPCLLNPMSLFYTHKASEQLSRCSMSIGEMDSESCFVSDDDAEEGIRYNGTTNGNVFCFGRVAFKQPCILIMDSLGSHATPALVTVLQEYLEMEWWVRKGSRRSFGKGAMNGWSLQVPQQDNNTDCGVYLLQYAESFITNPPPIFHPAVDLSDWFHLKLVKKKREQIKRLIFRLHHQQLDLGN